MKLTKAKSLVSFWSFICPSCGEPKDTRTALCDGCKKEIPYKIRASLYLPMHAGYTTALARALDYLKVKSPHCPTQGE